MQNYWVNVFAGTVANIISFSMIITGLFIFCSIGYLFGSNLFMFIGVASTVIIGPAAFMRFVADSFTPPHPVKAYAKLLGINFASGIVMYSLQSGFGNGVDVYVVYAAFVILVQAPWAVSTIKNHK